MPDPCVCKAICRIFKNLFVNIKQTICILYLDLFLRMTTIFCHTTVFMDFREPIIAHYYD